MFESNCEVALDFYIGQVTLNSEKIIIFVRLQN